MVGHHYLVNPIQSLRLGLCNNSPTKKHYLHYFDLHLINVAQFKNITMWPCFLLCSAKKKPFQSKSCFRHAAKENVPRLVAKRKIRLGLLRLNSLLCTRQSFFLVSKHFKKFNNFLLLTAALDSSLHQSLHNNKWWSD